MSLLSPCKRKWTPSPLAGEGWGEVQSSKLESPQPLRCSGDASLPTPNSQQMSVGDPGRWHDGKEKGDTGQPSWFCEPLALLE